MKKKLIIFICFSMGFVIGLGFYRNLYKNRLTSFLEMQNKTKEIKSKTEFYRLKICSDLELNNKNN